jgi:hypothetical protein
MKKILIIAVLAIQAVSAIAKVPIQKRSVTTPKR